MLTIPFIYGKSCFIKCVCFCELNFTFDRRVPAVSCSSNSLARSLSLPLFAGVFKRSKNLNFCFLGF